MDPTYATTQLIHPARLRYCYPQVTNSTLQIVDYAEYHIRSRRRDNGVQECGLIDCFQNHART